MQRRMPLLIKRIPVRVEQSLNDAIATAAAKKDFGSVSEYIRQRLKAAVRKDGVQIETAA